MNKKFSLFGLRREVASMFLFQSRSLLSGQFVGFRQVRPLEGGRREAGFVSRGRRVKEHSR